MGVLKLARLHTEYSPFAIIMDACRVDPLHHLPSSWSQERQNALREELALLDSPCCSFSVFQRLMFRAGRRLDPKRNKKRMVWCRRVKHDTYHHAMAERFGGNWQKLVKATSAKTTMRKRPAALQEETSRKRPALAKVGTKTAHHEDRKQKVPSRTLVQVTASVPCDVFDTWVRWERGQVRI